MTSLEEAKAALGQPKIELVPTGDDALDKAREKAVAKLGRALRPAESFRLAQGLPLGEDDGIEGPAETIPPPPSALTPEDVFKAAENGEKA